MSLISPHSRGLIISVRAVPRAGRSGVAGTRGDALLVRLAAAPVDGAANDELIAVLSKALGIPRRQFSIVAGQQARDKCVLVEGASLSQLEGRLSNILNQTGS